MPCGQGRDSHSRQANGFHSMRHGSRNLKTEKNSAVLVQTLPAVVGRLRERAVGVAGFTPVHGRPINGMAKCGKRG
jgi:hypothetical protein